MEPEYIFYTNDRNMGGRVHPRNWMYRVSEWTATFKDNKLDYDELLIPMVCNGRCCLRINMIELKIRYPEIYKNVILLINELDAKQLIQI